MVLSGRYEVVRRLGAGAIGVVHQAQDRILGETVALKILHPHLRNEPAVLDAFRREVAIGRLVDHPGVARIHDMGTDPHTQDVYLVMEYLPGGDLKRRIATQGALEAPQILPMADTILGALKAAHGKGVVHRDLKPHNILFDPQGGARLSDFGLARCGALAGPEDEHRIVGTPEYLAPESVESGYADARSDLYSFGIVLYEAATGRLPFETTSVYEMLQRHTTTPAPRLPPDCPGYDPRLARVVERLLDRDPSRRFQTAADVAEALRGEVPAALAPPTSHPCPNCGSAVPDGFPYCFACRREPLYLTPAAEGARTWRVVVTGPGKPGDQVGHELRTRCLGLVRDMSVDTRRLARRLPRVPFVLVRGLGESDAQRMVEALRQKGLEAEAVAGRLGGGSRPARRKVLRKDFLMSARVVGILAASMGGTFASVGGRIAERGVAVGIVLAGLFVIAPLVTVLRHRLAEVIWKPGEERLPAKALARYLALAPRVTSPTLQALMRRIVLRQEELGRLAKDTEVVRDAATVVLQAADWMETCQALEDRLEQADERALYRRMADLRSARADDAPSEVVARTMERLDSRRNLERARGVLLDRILAFSARLDALVVTMTSTGAKSAGAAVRDLERLAGEAALAVEAIREVEDRPVRERS